MGDLGCSLGPWTAGLVTDLAAPERALGKLKFLPGAGNAPLQAGILACIIFPLVFVIAAAVFMKHGAKKADAGEPVNRDFLHKDVPEAH
jgi:hypothetical protein